MRKKYYYYNVDIPLDCETDQERRFDLAILTVKESIEKIFHLPCNWRLISDKDGIVKICKEVNF